VLQNKPFRVHLRFTEFLRQLKDSHFLTVHFVIHALGWWLTFFLAFHAYEQDYYARFFLFLIHGYFWYSLNKSLLTKLLPPIEILLAAVLFIAVLDFSLLNATKNLPVLESLSLFEGWTLRGIIHKFLLSFLVLFLGLIILIGSKKEQGVLIIYILFGVAGHWIFFYDQHTFLIIFQFFLFFSLLKRTAWLETLTRVELLIYFAVLLWFFLLVTEPAFFKFFADSVTEPPQAITFSLPYFLYMTIKLYWLALLVRIPMVVIYNHAGLSRKLRIAGLLQSTFPLFIQLSVLILIFFLFTSGWQANQLRDRLMQSIETSLAENPQRFHSDSGNFSIDLPGYAPLPVNPSIPRMGVMEVTMAVDSLSEERRDYFFYARESSEEETEYKLLKIDSTFFDQAGADLYLLAGTGLLAYQQSPGRWMQLFNKIQLWQPHEVFRINPFALIFPLASGFESDPNVVRNRFIDQPQYNKNWRFSIVGYSFNNPLLIAGRLNIPLVSHSVPSDKVFIIDIYFDLRSIWQWNFLTQIMLALFILFILFNSLIIRRVIAFGSQINDSVVHKFAEIKNGIRQVSSGNLDYQVEIEGEDEFVELADRFNQMSVRLQETIAEAREKDRLDQELKIARQVQLSLLPERLPEITGYEIVAHLQTATEIGGDFYDVIALDEDRFLFALGDVSGKGSSAAFYMAQLISLLRFLPRFTEKPQEIAQRLNEYMMHQVSDRQIFVTAVIGVLNTMNHQVELVRAGHNLPILLKPGTKNVFKEIQCPGLGIGLTKSADAFAKALRPYRFTFGNNVKLILYSDGIVEAIRPKTSEGTDGEDFEMYGEDRLKALLIEKQLLPANELLGQVTADLDRFYGSHPRVDDHTILILEKQGPGKKS
jgi:serine phosphatase RsbU (regulator of sigma subunit)